MHLALDSFAHSERGEAPSFFTMIRAGDYVFGQSGSDQLQYSRNEYSSSTSANNEQRRWTSQ